MKVATTQFSILIATLISFALGACTKEEEKSIGSRMGTISFDSVTQTSFHVGWTAATTDATDPLLIQYKAVYSANNNISTISMAEANGALISDWATNSFGTTLSGMTPYTTYTYQAIVGTANGIYNGNEFTLLQSGASPYCNEPGT